MSENESERDEVEPGRASPGPPVDPVSDDDAARVPQATPGPRVVPSDDDASESPTEEAEYKREAIPGEYPEDNPDLKGEDRFDAG